MSRPQLKSTLSPILHGVDFTSAPRKAKGITIASGQLIDDAFELQQLQVVHDFSQFQQWLIMPGPWVAGFDFPFSLPRELVDLLNWPTEWPALIQHYASLSREEIRTTFKAVCDSRPPGNKFIHRKGDTAAGSSSSMKWVNPPVAYMLHAGAPLLLGADISIPFMHVGDPQRIALEAYPGMVARSITRDSYKSDTPSMQTPERRAARLTIINALEKAEHPYRIALYAGPFRERLLNDGSGDLLDAVLCAILAAWGWQRRDSHYGLPVHDALEGWIVGA
jgi:hypothetical protein